jgi:hypothetical protein
MLTGYHFQNAYLTRDIDKAIAGFRARGDVDECKPFRAEVEVETPWGRRTLVNLLAFIWIDNLQYELIQPISGVPEVYDHALADHDGLAFHHVCMRVNDWSALKSSVVRQGLPIVMEGGNENLNFLYVDARDSLGHYLEYGWMTPKVWVSLGGKPELAEGA